MLDRKEFLTGIASATVTLIIHACGGDDSQGSPAGDGDGNCTNDVSTTITNNHGHTLSVPATDFDAGQSKTYSIKGTSDHDHSVTLGPTDFADLKSGKKITKESTTNSGHSHPMQISC